MSSDMSVDISRLLDFTRFVAEREKIRILRAQKVPPPWTSDPILGRYRFCNVNREHDTVTQWIAANIRTGRSLVWFNLCVARLFNWPETLADIGYINNYGPSHVERVCAERKAAGKKVFTGAYIVSTNGHRMDKAQYIARMVLLPLWQCRDLHPGPSSCASWAKWLMGFNGFSDFMANQVVTDMKYCTLRNASDSTTFCLAGPGTIRGLNRLFKRPTDANLHRGLANLELLHVRKLINERGLVGPNLFTDLNNLSNCFCEFDKYERVRLGEGRPRATYTPKA